MASADQTKLASRRLTHWLENERKIVTYRDVSRDVGCHVNTAKNLLLAHHTSHPHLNPTYLLTGPLLASSSLASTDLPSVTQETLPSATQMVRIVDMDEMSDADRNSEADEDEQEEEEREGEGEMEVGNDKGGEGGLVGDSKVGMGPGREGEVVVAEDVPRWGVVLVQADRLDEKRNLFEEGVTVTIYSLSPSAVNDPAQYLVPTLELRSHAKYRDPAIYGTITGDTFGVATGVGSVAAMKDGGMEWGKGVNKGSGKTGVDAKGEEKKAGDVSRTGSGLVEPTPVKETLKVPGPQAAKTNDVKDPSVPGQTQSAKPGASKKKRVIADSDDDDPPASATSAASSSKERAVTPEVPVPKRPKAKIKAKVKTEQPDPATPPQTSSSMVRAEERAAMEAMMGMEMDMDMADDGEETAGSQPKSGKKVGGSSAASKKRTAAAEKDGGVKIKSEPGRKRRQVMRSTTETNEKGYTVTKDHMSEESYSGESEGEVEGAAKDLARTQSGGVEGEEKRKSGSGPAVGGGAKAMPKPQPVAAAGTKRGQSTLQGFFKKK